MSTHGDDLHSTMVGEQGPVVVFLHGLFGRGRNFGATVRALQPHVRALLVDLPPVRAVPEQR